MVVRVGVDNNQFNIGIVQYFVEIVGEMDMGINGSLFFRFRMATKNMRDMLVIFAVKYIRQMVTGGVFVEVNKGVVDDYDFVFFKVVIYILA